MGIFTVNNMINAVKLNGLTESFLPPMILNMTITASIMILFVLLARLVLKKAPKIFSYALWAVVLFRLLCPVSITTDFSLLGLFDTPAVENTQHTTAMEYIPYDVVHTPDLEVQLPVPPAINEVVNNALPQEHAALGADPLEGDFAIGSFVWLLGIAGMAIYSAVSYFLLRRKLVGAVLLRDNIYLADGIGSPFVMGFIRPKIYLPSTLSEQEQSYIILHEQHHIRRGDHIIKALAFIALCIHWFNPLVWVAFVLSSKDMEMSCDEAVVKKLGEGIRADYSASLLSLATGRRIIAGTPLAFGEGDTKSRIKNILNWKKPKTWIIFIAVITSAVVMVFCVSNPLYLKDVRNKLDDNICEKISIQTISPALGEAKSFDITASEDIDQLTALLRETSFEKSIRKFKEAPDNLAAEISLINGEESFLSFLLLSDSQADTMAYSVYARISTGEGKYHYLMPKTSKLSQYFVSLIQNATTEPPVYDTASDISYYLELAAGGTFQDMALERQVGILVEYEDLLDNYTLIARESADGTAAYIVGQYNGDPAQSPLYGIYSVEVSLAEEEGTFQFLYREEASEAVDAVLSANNGEFPLDAGYRIEDSKIYWSADSGLILIQHKDNALFLDVPWNRYLHTPNGREYIVDAVSRGIDVCGRTDTYLYVYRISEQFGEISERIALTEAEAQAILAEERVNITDGFGFSASLHIDGQTTYYNEREGIPPTVLDLALKRCDYRWGDPSYITDTIREARLDCDWLDAPLYADEADLPRLREILKNAEQGYVGSCGYGAKLTLTFTGGEKMTVFKGCDGCDAIVFGSYGGYFLGEKENIEFWEMFGLNPDTKNPIDSTYDPKAFVSAFLQSEDVGNLLNGFTPWDLYYDLDTYEYTETDPLSCYVYYHLPRSQFESFRTALQEHLGGMPDEIRIDGNWDETGGDPRDIAVITVSGERSRAEIEQLAAVARQSQGLPPVLAKEEQEQLPTAPPTESDIHNAIMANNRWATKTDALYPYRTEAHHIWGTKWNGTRCAVYALGYRTTYEWGNGQPKRIYPEQVGSMELVFEWDGKWQLASFWMPAEDEDSIVSIRNRFPADIAAIVLGEVDSDILADLNTQCHENATQYYATLTDLPPANPFTPADEEFSGQTLTGSPDEMTYEERLQWVQAGPDYSQTFTALGQYAESEGCIAYLATWVGVPRGNGQVFQLRFADGMLAYLPMPDDNAASPALPDSMVFTGGKFVYEKAFPSEEVTNEGETLIHLKGTYHYEVDLVAKTVSLTIVQ